MKEKRVKKCIVCLKPVKFYTGHLLAHPKQHINKAISAGFCVEHINEPCPNAFNEIGCFGLYKKEYGLETVDIFNPS